MSSSNPEIDEIVNDILNSPKYRRLDICQDTIRDLINQEIKNYKKKSDAIGSVKKKLHGTIALYLGDPDYPEAAGQLRTIFEKRDPALIKEFCLQMLSYHVSTKERIPNLEAYYRRVFDLTCTPKVILDIACGLNPFSFLWMNLPLSTKYYAYDLRRDRIDFLNEYFTMQGLEPLATYQDILVNSPQEEGDVAFIFKEVHRFEKRQRGCTLSLLEALKAKYIVISLPSRSIGQSNDLSVKHRTLFYDIVEGKSWKINEIEFDNELIFIIEK